MEASCRRHQLGSSKPNLVWYGKRDAPYTLGRVENQKSLIFSKSQAGLYGAHKNKVIHHISKFQNICLHIGNAPEGAYLKILKYAYNFFSMPL